MTSEEINGSKFIRRYSPVLPAFLYCDCEAFSEASDLRLLTTANKQKYLFKAQQKKLPQ